MEYRLKLLTVMLVLCFYTQASYSKDVIEKFPQGVINWSEAVLYATGMGYIRGNNADSAKMQLMARRVAIVDCHRNLLEMSKGVRITSTKSVGTLIKEKNSIQSRIEGIIRNATLVNEYFRKEEGIFTVTMKMPMEGEFLRSVITDKILLNSINPLENNTLYFFQTLFSMLNIFTISEAHAVEFDSFELPTLRKVQQYWNTVGSQEFNKEFTSLIKTLEQHPAYTGIVIDARHIKDFKTATIPQLRDQHDTIFYPGDYVPISNVTKKLPVKWDSSIEDAANTSIICCNPLKVKAISTFYNKKSELVINNKDVTQMISLQKKYGYLSKSKVIIVVSEDE
jgi:hypothetical protein